MKSLVLSLTTTLENGRLIIDKVEADNMLQLLTQFNLVIARVMREIEESKPRKDYDDDIPF